MLVSKRIMTDAELDHFLKLREVSNDKAAKYMKSLQNELFETVESTDKYDTRSKRSARNPEVTED